MSLDEAWDRLTLRTKCEFNMESLTDSLVIQGNKSLQDAQSFKRFGRFKMATAFTGQAHRVGCRNVLTHMLSRENLHLGKQHLH